MRNVLGSFAVAMCLALAGAIVLGQTAPSEHPVKVHKCNPVEGTAAYIPPAGYYVVGPYRWVDPYGYGYYQPPVTTPTLEINYTNISKKVAATVDFGLYAKGHIIAETHDVGTFSPGALIKHSFGLNPNVFPIGTSYVACPVLRVVYEDGSIWLNPKMPPRAASLLQQRHPAH